MWYLCNCCRVTGGLEIIKDFQKVSDTPLISVLSGFSLAFPVFPTEKTFSVFLLFLLLLLLLFKLP